MSADLDVIRRLQAGAEAISIEPPDPAPAARVGRRRAAGRVIGVATVVVLIGAAATWAIMELGGLRANSRPRVASSAQPNFDPTASRPIHVPYSDQQVPIPYGWESSTAQGLHFWLGLAASTNPGAVGELVQGCGSPSEGCSIRSFREGELERDDAFVEVGIRYGPNCFSCPEVPAIPRRIRPANFVEDGKLLGTPRYVLGGTGADGGIYQIAFWNGPDASSATVDATAYLLENLHIPPPEPTPSSQSYTDPDRKFAVEYPDDWTRAEATLTPHLSSPAEIFAAGTYPLRVGGESCWHFPVNAMEDLGPTDALVWIAEAEPFGGDYPRPESFAHEPPDQQMEARYCLQDPEKPYTQWWIRFSQGNRSFYVFVAMGDEISDERRAETWNMLESFTPEPAPDISPKAEQPSK